MTLYRFSLSSLLVALVAFQHTYASINIDENQILKAVFEEYCSHIPCNVEKQKTKKHLDAKIKIGIALKLSASIKTQCVSFPQNQHFESPHTFQFPIIHKYQWIISGVDAISTLSLASYTRISPDNRTQIAKQNLQLRI